MFDFRQLAACAQEGVDPELFFPITHGGPCTAQEDRAKAICARCPVRGDCLALALNQGLDHGIFGGLTEGERRQLNRRPVPA